MFSFYSQSIPRVEQPKVQTITSSKTKFTPIRPAPTPSPLLTPVIFTPLKSPAGVRRGKPATVREMLRTKKKMIERQRQQQQQQQQRQQQVRQQEKQEHQRHLPQQHRQQRMFQQEVQFTFVKFINQVLSFKYTR